MVNGQWLNSEIFRWQNGALIHHSPFTVHMVNGQWSMVKFRSFPPMPGWSFHSPFTIHDNSPRLAAYCELVSVFLRVLCASVVTFFLPRRHGVHGGSRRYLLTIHDSRLTISLFTIHNSLPYANFLGNTQTIPRFLQIKRPRHCSIRTYRGKE